MSRGHDRERQVRRHLEDEGWFVARACGSLGDVDLVALKAGHVPRLIEVKSSPYAFAHFGPQDRAELLAAARIAGARPMLAHWPPRKPLEWLKQDRWPR